MPREAEPCAMTCSVVGVLHWHLSIEGAGQCVNTVALAQRCDGLVLVPAVGMLCQMWRPRLHGRHW